MDDQQRARELLAEEYERMGWPSLWARMTLSGEIGDFDKEPQLAAITAALRAAPEGFVLVPVEPTRGMVHGLASALDYPSVYMGGPSESSVRKAKRLYATIISARPHAKP